MAAQNIVVGNWGGLGGVAWNDGAHTGVRQINLSHGEAIGNFQAIYDLNGQSSPGDVHLSRISFPYNREIVLDFPREYIMNVSGYTAPWPSKGIDTPVIRSLTFQTNMRTLEPIGARPEDLAPNDRMAFNLPIEKGLIVGFQGRTGDVLNGIGVHLAL